MHYSRARVFAASLGMMIEYVCQVCGSKQMDLEWKKGSSPLDGGVTSLQACIICSEKVQPLCVIKHGKAFVARRGGRGRGRRGRGRGRGRRRDGDPLLSFRDF